MKTNITGLLIRIGCFLGLMSGWGQPACAQDSTYTLSASQFKEWIIQFHPVARQAMAGIKIAEADRLKTRGAFDPKIAAERSEKTFDGLEYFQYRRTEWQVPTWFGIEFRGGWEYLQGARTPETETLGTSSYVGLSLPLLRGLSMDKRRADLRKATLGIAASMNERNQLLNEVLAEALDQYWEWVRAHELEKALDSLLQLNQARISLIRSAVDGGDRPAIDSIEALVQLGQWQITYQDAVLSRKNATWKLADHLWTEKGEPVLLPEAVEPDKNTVQQFADQTIRGDLEEWIRAINQKNPGRIALDYQLKQSRIDRTFYRQELLPSVRLEYNQLGKSNDLIKTLQQPWVENNFKYGLRIAMPLRLSAERGQLRATEWKIKQLTWKQDLLEWKLANQLRSLHQQLQTVAEQTRLQTTILEQNRSLSAAEWLKFQQGESNLFLVNIRESRYQESRQKLMELQYKFRKSEIGIQQIISNLIP